MYKCQLCGHDGPLSLPCPRCEPIADSDPAAFLPAIMHRLRATRMQLLDDDSLRQVLAEKEATILSLRATVDLARNQNAALARKENEWALAVNRIILDRVKTPRDKEIVRGSMAVHERIADVLKKAVELDENFNSEVDAEIANALDYILGVVPADECGVLNRHVDVAAN